MALVACSTHALLVDSLLFAGPVIMIALVLLVVTWRERRRERGELLESGAPQAT